MRALILLAGCAAAALCAAGCGGGGGGTTSAGPTVTPTAEAPRATLVVAGLEPPGGCYVTVFLIEDATKAQIARVQEELLASPALTAVSFVSKELELRRFAQEHPAEAKGMHVNPFAARFEVVPRNRGSALAIVGHFAVHGGPITNAKPSVECSGPA